MQEWEYARLTVEDGGIRWSTLAPAPRVTEGAALDEVVAQAGREGWELVQVHRDEWLFKRPGSGL